MNGRRRDLTVLTHSSPTRRSADLPMTAPTRALRGRLLSFRDDPATAGTGAYTYIEDGLVLVAGGDILDVGEARALLSRVPETVAVDHFPDALILPGFIAAHIHFPQPPDRKSTRLTSSH